MLNRIKQNFKYECYCFSNNFKIYKEGKTGINKRAVGRMREERKQNLEQLVYFSELIFLNATVKQGHLSLYRLKVKHTQLRRTFG